MRNTGILPFREAHKLVLETAKNFGIDSELKWVYQKKYGYIRAKGVPHSPNVVYKNKGWVSWSHWLGTKNIRGTLRKYEVNDHFFKKWSDDMAYILGFWWADGYIRKRFDRYSFMYGFGLCQQTKDKYILEKILKKMGSNNPICNPKTRPNMSHFEIFSKVIFDDISKIGGVPNKSKIIRLPKIPKKYTGDFIRGLFDGDGCVCINKKHKYRTSYICSGNIFFLRDLEELLKKREIFGSINSNGAKTPCYKLDFGVNQTKNLGRLMYENIRSDLKLVRKFEKFINDGEPIWKKKA